jgi:hypothetical protein
MNPAVAFAIRNPRLLAANHRSAGIDPAVAFSV